MSTFYVGWWKGRLKGQVGVFPSNFVQVIDTGSPTTQLTSALANKLNLIGNKTSKTNSLNNNNITNNGNTNNGNNYNNLIMNAHQDNTGLNPSPATTTSTTTTTTTTTGNDPSIVSSERLNNKPSMRTMGYGDIFSAGNKSKPLPVDPTGERLVNSSGIVNALQKQIPKKPPPPTPTLNDSPNVDKTSSDQAPALPPRPVNQFNPHLQHSRRPLLAHLQQQQQQPPPSAQQPRREQARVVYAYKPLNSDELPMEVGDIITVLDKKLEDAGWWRGELNGKEGVFPDNFVELIEPATQPEQPWQQYHNKTSVGSLTSEAKFKSVFAGTPKGFSKELEGNLERFNNPVSFLSLKRNKLQQEMSPPSESNMTETEKAKEVGDRSSKLNHITANRAKGPSRRPPSNILGKRVQSDQQQMKGDINGQDLNSSSEGPQTSIPSSQAPTTNSSPSLTADQQNDTSNQVHCSPVTPTSVKPIDVVLTNNSPSRVNSIIESVDNNFSAPRTSQRGIQPHIVPEKAENNATNTPPWMVELKKTHAEKKTFTSNSNSVSTPTVTASTIAAHSNTTNATNTTASSLANSREATSELADLRQEVKQLQNDVKVVVELKDTVEKMRQELRDCQSAIDTQRRYIKELVNNLADERKKIAAMQAELNMG